MNSEKYGDPPALSGEQQVEILSRAEAWLSQASELGRKPDTLRILASRELAWPRSGRNGRWNLVRYHAVACNGELYDQVGVILIGESIWSLASTDTVGRPPEDVFALYACWDLRRAKVLQYDESVQGEIISVENVKYPEGLYSKVAILQMRARLAAVSSESELQFDVASTPQLDIDGWLIRDAGSSRFYEKSVMPKHTTVRDVLDIHIGRTLLGFGVEKNRAMFLVSPNLPAPERVISLWRARELKAKHATGARREELFHPAVGEVNRVWLREYASALSRVSRKEELRDTLDLLEREWPKDCHDALGEAAYVCGMNDRAEKYLMVAYKRDRQSYMGTSMHTLVILLCNNAKRPRAVELLLDCLKKTLDRARRAKGADRRILEETYQDHRRLFIRLFPQDANASMSQSRLPSSTFLDE